MLNIHAGIPHHIANAVYWVGNMADDLGSIFAPVKSRRFRTGKPHRFSHVKDWVVVGRTLNNRRNVYGERVLLRMELTLLQAHAMAEEMRETGRVYGRAFKNICAVPADSVPGLMRGEG